MVLVDYRKVKSSNTSRFEAYSGFFRLLMKGIIDLYVMWPFDTDILISIVHQNSWIYSAVPASILYFLWSISHTSSLLWLAQVTGGILTIVSEENVGSSMQSTAFLLSFCPIFSGFESKEWSWHQLYKNKCYKSVGSWSIEVHSI